MNFYDHETSQEYRLYMETDFEVKPSARVFTRNKDLKNVAQLLELKFLTVQKVTVTSDADLTVAFENGHVLKVSGTPNKDTAGDVWDICEVN